MWENVIGIVNEQAGTNTGVEALINAPTIGGGRKASKARQQAAAQAVMATGGFDTAVTSYQSLLALAKTQGAVGGSATRGACKVCGQLGHLTKQCRNQFSKFYEGGPDKAGEAGGGLAAAAAAAAEAAAADSDGSSSLSSDSSDSSGDERRQRRKEKRRRREKHSSKSSSRDKKSSKERKEKLKQKKEKKSSKDKERREKRRRRSSSPKRHGSDSD